MLINFFKKISKKGVMGDVLFWLIVMLIVLVILVIAIMILFGKGQSVLGFIKDWMTGG